MNGRMIVGMLAAMAALTTLAFAQGVEERGENQEWDPEYQLALRHRQLELEAREAELDFQAQMRELELEERRAAFERRLDERAHPERRDQGGGAALFAVCVVVNILLTIWVYQDIRKRNAGSGLWIVITLLTGFLGALVYALVRLGDVRQQGS